MPEVRLTGLRPVATLPDSIPHGAAAMALDIQLTLSDADLAPFTDGLKRSQQQVRGHDPAAIVAEARKLLDDTRGQSMPSYIRERLDQVEPMIAMAEDKGFELAQDERERVLAVLAYLADPVDFIPDTVPALGFLDDAIMVELAQNELQHEIEAYSDFSAWRADEARRRGEDPAKLGLVRLDWADARRAEAMEQMRRRRSASYISGDWQPTLFRIG